MKHGFEIHLLCESFFFLLLQSALIRGNLCIVDFILLQEPVILPTGFFISHEMWHFLKHIKSLHASTLDIVFKHHIFSTTMNPVKF